MDTTMVGQHYVGRVSQCKKSVPFQLIILHKKRQHRQKGMIKTLNQSIRLRMVRGCADLKICKSQHNSFKKCRLEVTTLI